MKSNTDSLMAGLRRLASAIASHHLPAVLRVHFVLIAANVGPINRKRRQHFAQRVAQAFERKIARPAMLLGDMIQLPRQHIQLARHGHLQDQPLAVAHQIVERLGPAGEAAIELLERFLLGVIHEEAVHQVEKS